MQPGKAFVGGVLGAAIATLLMAIARVLHAPINVELLLGSAITGDGGLGSWLLGFALLLLLGGLVGLVYGAAFERITHQADAPTGTLLSLAHLLVSGLLVGWLGSGHPLVPDVIDRPGPFYASAGSFPVAVFLLVHLVYGAIVGAVYRPVRVEHRREIPA